jgi:hypothetical protein
VSRTNVLYRAQGELPKNDYVKGWEMFYDQVTVTGYRSNSASEEQNRENEHWKDCRVRWKGGGTEDATVRAEAWL